MDATLKGLVALVAGPDVEVRCAAVLILTNLSCAHDKAVKAVGETLGHPNIVVREFAIGYFERVRPPEGLVYLLPLLDAHEEPVRARVVSILEGYGARAISAAKRLLDTDPPRRRILAIIDLCAHVRTAAALDILFDLMASKDIDTNRATCDALLAVVPSLDARERADLYSRTEHLASGAKGHRATLVAAAKLFGAFGEAKARKRLFSMLGKREPTVVRTHALTALTHCLRGKPLTQSEIDTLLTVLEEEDDEAGFLRPSVRLLEDQPLDRTYLARLNRLAECPKPCVKRLAVEKLGHFDSGTAVRTLIGYLTDDSYARRDQATASLKAMPAARNALMKELLDCNEERIAWTIADILLVHDRKWKRDVQEALSKRLEQAVEKREDRLWAAYFHFLNTLDADKLTERLRARAATLRKTKKFAESAKMLGLLRDSAAFDEDTRFAFAVAELKSHSHSLTNVARRHDIALEALCILADSTFPLANRLCRERPLSPDDLYYIAFNFAEGKPQEKDVARELLEYLATKHGRTKVGKAAKNKLRLLPAGD